MTGYGSGDSVNKGIKILVELSSVNRKQVEVAVSVPNELESLEPTIRKSILESVSRGRVSGRISIQRPISSANRSVFINNDQADYERKKNTRHSLYSKHRLAEKIVGHNRER